MCSHAGHRGHLSDGGPPQDSSKYVHRNVRMVLIVKSTAADKPQSFVTQPRLAELHRVMKATRDTASSKWTGAEHHPMAHRHGRQTLSTSVTVIAIAWETIEASHSAVLSPIRLVDKVIELLLLAEVTIR